MGKQREKQGKKRKKSGKILRKPFRNSEKKFSLSLSLSLRNPPQKKKKKKKKPLLFLWVSLQELSSFLITTPISSSFYSYVNAIYIYIYINIYMKFSSLHCLFIILAILWWEEISFHLGIQGFLLFLLYIYAIHFIFK